MGSKKEETPGASEFNPQSEEFLSYPEFSPLVGTASSSRRVAGMVENSSSEEAPKTETKKKENKVQAFFRKMLISTTVAVAAVVTAETVGIIGMSAVTVQQAYVETSETAVWYSMELEGYEENGDELAVEVYNDFVHYREPLRVEEDYNDSHSQNDPGRDPNENPKRYAYGEIYDLKPDTDYTLEVFFGSWTVYKQKIHTAKQAEPEPEPDDPGGDTPVEPSIRDTEFYPSENGISYFLTVSGYRESDQLSVLLLRGADLIRQNEAFGISVDQPYLSGEFTDLEPDTEYTIQVTKNGEIIYSNTVLTPQATEPVIEPEPEFHSTENSISYSIPVSDYTENDWLMVLLLQNDDQVRSNRVTGISVEEPYANGEFADLDSQTEYTVQLMKNQQVVGEWTVSTLEPAPEPPEAWFEATENSILYSIPITDYRETDDLTVLLFDVTGMSREESADVVFTEGWPFASGTFADLEPGVEYTIQLIKNGDVIYSDAVSTQEAEEEPLEAQFEATENTISYFIPITDYQPGAYLALYLLENGDFIEEVPVQVSDEKPYVSGEFTKLDSGTDFTIQLVQNQQMIEEWSISTLPEAWFEVSETDIFYFIPFVDYQEGDDVKVVLTDIANESREQDAEVVAEEEYPYVTGSFADLQPGAGYTIQLIRNGDVIYSNTVFTQEAEADLPEAWFEITDTSISYSIPVSEYSADDRFMVLLIEPTGGGREDEPEAVTASDGLYLTGQFSDLYPDTEYTIQLIRNQETIYSNIVSTQEAGVSVGDGDGVTPAFNG